MKKLFTILITFFLTFPILGMMFKENKTNKQINLIVLQKYTTTLFRAEEIDSDVYFVSIETHADSN